MVEVKDDGGNDIYQFRLFHYKEEKTGKSVGKTTSRKFLLKQYLYGGGLNKMNKTFKNLEYRKFIDMIAKNDCYTSTNMKKCNVYKIEDMIIGNAKLENTHMFIIKREKILSTQVVW